MMSVDVLVTLNNTRSGRDKVFRLAQYTLKLIGGLRASPGDFRLVEKNIASLRKLLRFGTFIDTLYGIKRTIQYGDPNLRIITTMIRLALAGYLVTDHLVWLQHAGVIDINDRFMQRRSDQWWLLSIIFTLVRDLYDLSVVAADRRRSKADKDAAAANGNGSGAGSAGSFLGLLGSRREWHLFALQNRAVLLDLAANLLDLFLPLHYLSYLPLPNWAVGCIGATTSVAAAATKIDPSLVVYPSN